MRQRYVQIDGQLVPRDEATAELHYVIPDIAPFTANTGAFIEGKRQWREHLKEKNCDEMGHADVKQRGEEWAKRRAAFKARMKGSDKYAPPAEYDMSRASDPEQRTRLATEVLNRLHGRPTPPRKEVIKLTLDLSRNPRYGRR